jgi:hypothetical protein
MPYTLEDFGEIAKAAVSPGEVSSGEDRGNDLTETLRNRLNTVGGGKHDDPSREDLAIIVAMLRIDMEPSDVLTTFARSARGKDAAVRHRKFDDYMHRTIRRAKQYLEETGVDQRVLTLDFGRNHESNANRRPPKDQDGIIAEQAHLVAPQRTEWVWRPYIPAGRITMLAGDPGMGKSQIAIDLCARISRSATMPNCEARTSITGTCAIATAEDSTAETIRPRLDAAGADSKRIEVIRKVQIKGEERYLSFPRDLQLLYKYITDHGIRMFVIDPLNAFLGSATDTFRDHDVRLALGPLEEIAEQTGCAILVVAHLNKKTESSTLYRVGGSIGFVGAARSVLAVARYREDEDRMVMYSIKANLSRRPPALAYRMVGSEDYDASHIQWLGVSDFDPEKASTDEGSQGKKEVRDFLMEILIDSEVEAETVKKDADVFGIAWRTVKRYKHELGVTSLKRFGKWYWKRPERWKK